MSAWSLAGRTALVTGASQGIGEAVARRFAEAGARVILAARSRDRLEALAAEIGGGALAFPLDLSDPEAIGSRLKELPADAGPVEILVNNAGITADNLLLRMGLEDWERVLRVNLTGTYAITRVLVRGMLKQRWGRIISISSVVALMGNAGQANYAAAKAGLIGFSKSLARELAPRNVTVNVVAPGYIRTAMTEELSGEVKGELERAIPLQRIGTADDVAWASLYLASDQAGYVTGHVLNVSGGLYI